MGDNISEAKVVISTTATGDGAEKTVAGLEKATAQTKELAAANEQLATARGPAWSPDFSATGADQELKTGQEKTVLLEKELILATRRAQIEAIINGDTTGLVKLRQEMSIRQTMLAEMQREGITQQELNALVEEETVLIKQSTAAIEERMAAEAVEAEQNARGPLGMRGARGMVGALGQDMGLGSMGFELMGIAFLVETIYRGFERHEEMIKKEREEQTKLNDEISKEGAELDKIKNLDEVDSRRATILEKINELNEQRAGAEGDEYDKLTDQISAQETVLEKLDQMTPKVLEREEAERQTKEALEAQIAALDAINKKYETMVAQTERVLRTHEKIEEIQLGADIAAINRLERDGKISHEEAARERTTAKNAAGQNKFNEEQAAAAMKIKQLSDETNADRAQAAQKQQEADAAKQRDAEAEGAIAPADNEFLQAMGAASTAQNQRDDKLKKQLEDKQFALGGAMDDPLASDADIDQLRAEMEEIKKQQQASTAQFDADAAAAKAELAKAIAAAAKANIDAATASSIADDATKKSQETATKNSKAITETGQDIVNQGAEHDAIVKAEGPEDADKIEQGKIRDKKEAAEKRKKEQEGENLVVKQEIGDFRQQARIVMNEGGRRGAGDANAEMQKITEYIASHQSANSEQLDTLRAIASQLKAHGDKLNEHGREVKDIKQHIQDNRAGSH